MKNFLPGGVCQFFLAYFLLSSCNTISDQELSFSNEVFLAPKKEVPYAISKTIQLATDSNQYVYYTSNVSRVRGKDYFYGVDDTEELLHVYDLTLQKKILKIDLSFNPKNNFGEVAESYIQNFDSIFLLAPYEGRISLIDSSENLVGQWDFSRQVRNSDLLSLESGENGNHFSYLQKTKELILYGYGQFNPFKDWKYYQQPFKCSINLRDSSLTTFGVYPKVYLNKKRGVPGIDEETITSIASGNIYMSFPRSSEIQLLGRDKSIKKLYNVGSNFFDQTEMYNRTENYEILMQSYIVQPYFLNLLWDDAHSRFYRISKHALEYRLPNGKVSLQTDAAWSIIICDENMNVLGESLVDGKQYNFNSTFITREGLMVSKDSPSNHADNENTIEFDLFRFDL